MKGSNYLRNIFSIFGGNPLVWIIYVFLLILNWSAALLFWGLPAVILTYLELRKEKGVEDWEIILTPIINFIAFSVILADILIGLFKR